MQPTIMNKVGIEFSDSENSENGVYLEYAETVSESTSSDIEEAHATLRDCYSIPESAEPDFENHKTLYDSFKKNAQFQKCEVCNINFRTIEQVTDHYSNHKSEEVITCDVCNNILYKDRYNIHLKLHREFFKQRNRHSKVECTVCRKHVTKTYLKRHMSLHSTDEGNQRIKTCTICAKPMGVYYLADHMKRVHSQQKTVKNNDTVPKLKCPICYHMYKESTYKNHVARHSTRQKKYVCEECGKESSTLSTFSTHLLTHKEVYKYKCQFCPYRGKHLGLLKVHVRIHTKDYLYKCTTCDACFTTKSNLNTHEKTHLTEAQFICSACGKCYTRERTLQIHMISCHEGIKAFSCDICGKSYGCKSVMVAHKRRKHHVPYVRRVGRKPSYLMQEKQVTDVN